jgi:hypothetical protein
MLTDLQRVIFFLKSGTNNTSLSGRILFFCVMEESPIPCSRTNLDKSKNW